MGCNGSGAVSCLHRLFLLTACLSGDYVIELFRTGPDLSWARAGHGDMPTVGENSIDTPAPCGTFEVRFDGLENRETA